METTTENTLEQPSIKHRITVYADSDRLDEILQYCKDTWGHSKVKGKKPIWTWRVKGRFRDKKFVFSFVNEEDAIAFKLTKG